jgi:hypothetical protein
MLIVQRDVTQRAQLEGVLEELSHGQLSMLCEVGGWGWMCGSCGKPRTLG